MYQKDISETTTSINALQFAKASDPIVVTLFGILILVIELQSEKENAFIVLTDVCSKSTVSRLLHLLNAYLPMLVKAVENVMLSKLVQESKADAPIVLTLSASTTFFNVEHPESISAEIVVPDVTFSSVKLVVGTYFIKVAAQLKTETLHPLNASLAMLEIEDGITNVDKSVQL